MQIFNPKCQYLNLKIKRAPTTDALKLGC